VALSGTLSRARGAKQVKSSQSCDPTSGHLRGIRSKGRMLMLDLSTQKLQPNAFSKAPLTIVDTTKFMPLAKIVEIDLLEHGDPDTRNAWVSQQVFNLLFHARSHSKFWAKRLNQKTLYDLARAPVLSKRELAEQFEIDGCLLLGAEHGRAKEHSTSGSTGIATRFFVSDMNAAYNELRGLAQYLFDGRSLSLNRVSMGRDNVADKKGYAISELPNWAGALSGLFRSGKARSVRFQNGDYGQLGQELLRQPCGYFISAPTHLMSLCNAMGEDKFRKLQIVEFTSKGEQIPESLRDLCRRTGIRVRDIYSSEEVGPIGFECNVYPGLFHIATSNVVVECDGPLQQIDGHQVGKLLITHLHSYATPFIRYEVGDLGSLGSECRCGHRGPVISHLQGRISAFLRRRDGKLFSFFLAARHVDEVMPVKEWRVRQTALDKLIVEIVPLGEVTEKGILGLSNLIRSRSGPEFGIEVKVVDSIDWGASYKRMTFRCEIE